MPNSHSKPETEHIVVTRSPVLKTLLVGIGCLALVLGGIGVFLPVLPTTPFVLLAAACFARSSPRFYQFLMRNKYLGPYLRAWRLERRIPLKAKLLATFMILVTLIPSAIFIIPVMAVKVLALVTGAAVLAYIWRHPS